MSVTWVPPEHRDPTTMARVSFNTRGPQERSPKLERYLAEHDHLTPFEHLSDTFFIETPVFVARQIMRHRTFSYNELSLRYTESKEACYKPVVWRSQHKTSKQCSDGALPIAQQSEAWALYFDIVDRIWYDYQQLLELGVAREQARAILPMGTITRFYMTGNLRNWAQFLTIRLNDDVQPECHEVACAIAAQLNRKYGEMFRSLMK